MVGGERPCCAHGVGRSRAGSRRDLCFLKRGLSGRSFPGACLVPARARVGRDLRFAVPGARGVGSGERARLDWASRRRLPGAPLVAGFVVRRLTRHFRAGACAPRSAPSPPTRPSSAAAWGAECTRANSVSRRGKGSCREEGGPGSAISRLTARARRPPHAHAHAPGRAPAKPGRLSTSGPGGAPLRGIPRTEPSPRPARRAPRALPEARRVVSGGAARASAAANVPSAHLGAGPTSHLSSRRALSPRALCPPRARESATARTPPRYGEPSLGRRGGERGLRL